MYAGETTRKKKEMTELISTYNVELLTDTQSRDRIHSMLESYKEAYNRCADILVTSNTDTNIRDVHDAVYELLRKEFPDLPAQQCIKVYKDVLSAIRSARANKHKEFKTPTKKNLSARLDKRLYGKFSKESIEITADIGKGGRVKCELKLFPKIEEMFSRFPTKDPLIYEKNGRIFLSVPFILPMQVIDGESCVGVDLGMKRLFVTSEGNAFVDKKYLETRRGIRYLRRKLKSKGTKSAKRHLKEISKKERNLSKDMCHRAANALLEGTDAKYLIFEDLTKIKQKTSRDKDGHKRKRHNNAISQVPFYMFKEIVGHKAQRNGRAVVTVSPYNTSQMDSRTGKCSGKRQGCRYYCSDGVVFDADFNAAKNIAKRSKRPLSTDIVPTIRNMTFCSGRAQSTAQSWGCGNDTCKPLNL